MVAGDVDALISLGHALGKTGAVDETIAAYREAIRLRPNNAELLSTLGSALFALKRDSDGAAAAYRRAIDLQPNVHLHHLNLGGVLAHKGATDPAIAAYREAVRLKPDDVVARKALVGQLARKRAWDEAIAAFFEDLRQHHAADEPQPKQRGGGIAANGQIGIGSIHRRKVTRRRERGN